MQVLYVPLGPRISVAGTRGSFVSMLGERVGPRRSHHSRTMTSEPIEPPPSRYRMPDPRLAPSHGLVAAGGDLQPGTVLAAYRCGIFPWPDEGGRLLWWSPDP